jgi:hypothetical protein
MPSHSQSMFWKYRAQHEQRCRNDGAFQPAELFNLPSFLLGKDEVNQQTNLHVITFSHNTPLPHIQLYAKTSESKSNLLEDINTRRSEFKYVKLC